MMIENQRIETSSEYFQNLKFLSIFVHCTSDKTVVVHFLLINGIIMRWLVHFRERILDLRLNHRSSNRMFTC